MWSRAKNLPGRQFTVLGNTWALCGAWQHCCISLFLKNEGCFNMSIMHTCILPDNLFSWHCKSFKMDAKLGKYASGTKPVDSLQRIYWHGKLNNVFKKVGPKKQNKRKTDTLMYSWGMIYQGEMKSSREVSFPVPLKSPPSFISGFKKGVV